MESKAAVSLGPAIEAQIAEIDGMTLEAVRKLIFDCMPRRPVTGARALKRRQVSYIAGNKNESVSARRTKICASYGYRAFAHVPAPAIASTNKAKTIAPVVAKTVAAHPLKKPPKGRDRALSNVLANHVACGSPRAFYLNICSGTLQLFVEQLQDRFVFSSVQQFGGEKLTRSGKA
jgi:hypothetical protein